MLLSAVVRGGLYSDKLEKIHNPSLFSFYVSTNAVEMGRQMPLQAPAIEVKW